jgi:hypothetical protein
MAVIIPISGKAQHGKDSFAKLLNIELKKLNQNVLIVHYADAVKMVAKDWFGWDGNKDEAGRTLLQQIGTEKGRYRNPNIWVNIVVDLVKVFHRDYDFILIPDCRFPNEIDRWVEEDFDVISVRVERKNKDNPLLDFESDLTEEQKNHPSETSLDNYPFSYYIEAVDMNELLEGTKTFVRMHNINFKK